MAANTSKAGTNPLTLVLKLTVATLLVGYLVRSGHLDPKELWAVMSPLNVALGLGLVGLSTMLAAWRWVLLLRARGLHAGFGYGTALYLIGIFFNHALPGSVGGDVVRGYYLVADFPKHRVPAILSVLIDRVLGLYSFFILTLIATLFDFPTVAANHVLSVLALFALGMLAAMTGFFVVVFSRRLTRLTGLEALGRRIGIVAKVTAGFQGYGQHRVAVLLSIALSLVVQLVGLSLFYEMSLIMHEDVPWSAILFAAPMGFLVTAIPISPAGVGVGQVAFLYLFKVYLGRETQFGAIAITAFQLATATWGIVGALLYLKRRKPSELRAPA